jgi:hypothetical protein
VELPTIYPHLTPLWYQPTFAPYPNCCCFVLASSQTNTLFLPRIDWPGLPFPPMHCGIGNKRHCCMCCRKSLLIDSHVVVHCSFSDAGFPFMDASLAYPCYSSYPMKCFAVGPPFGITCRKDGSGPCLPPLKSWPNFICLRGMHGTINDGSKNNGSKGLEVDVF